ncbi:juvenile hormone binding protein-like precursor [Acyrthosiphon pisum]|uniref:Protein takeout n=2 Tax=Acyrthosiphon pisum TaxID=7029 RepID=A0A8R1XIB1_ACYPI|nr:juvenile hormone binding protein-like precursor [Acyrthosiphon pisum]|eukprot:NP_001191889.1 juvenile hormone binding protein-like precursor [Acyrthosiphon pisum]
MYITLHLALAAIIGFGLSEARQQEHDIAYYIHPCQRSGPNINECLTYSANHLTMHLRKGIPELGIEEVEPIVIDEINLSLGSGPDGYRATFKDIQAFGVSNLTVNQVRSDLNTLQFQLTFSIPKISAIAHYRSSGVLIMVQATGGGEYWGEYEGVKAKVYIKASEVERNSRKYLHLEDLKMDFSVKDIQMGIKNVHNGNAVLEAALNLFINSNSQELLKEMKPHIKKKLMVGMKSFIDNLFSRVPYDSWVID